MSDENEPDNPYQPPATRGEPLAKKLADGPKAKPHPVHWLLPILGYAYVPAIFIVASLPDYAISQRMYGIAGTLNQIVEPFALLIFIVLPVYVVAILLLGWRRHRQGTNTLVISLYHGLSLILPTLWFAWALLVAYTGGF